MKLHQDREAFGALLSVVSRRMGIRGDIIEKDYYSWNGFLRIKYWRQSFYYQRRMHSCLYA